LDRPHALTDEIGFVSLEAMQAEAVLVGINGGGPDLQFVGGRKMRMAISPRFKARSF